MLHDETSFFDLDPLLKNGSRAPVLGETEFSSNVVDKIMCRI